MKLKNTKLPLYYLQWDDHWGSSGWVSGPPKDVAGSLPVESVGFLIKEDKKGYFMATAVAAEAETSVPYNGVNYILKSAVIRKKRISL